MEALRYLLMSSACLLIFFSSYKLLFRKGGRFGHQRLFLLSSIVISLLLPVFNVSIQVRLFTPKTEQAILPEQDVVPVSNNLAEQLVSPAGKPVKAARQVNWSHFLRQIYLIAVFVLLSRLVAQFTILFVTFYRSNKIKEGNITIAINQKYASSFNVFSWVFIHSNSVEEKSLKEIIIHEKIHASQYHSIDLLLVELLSAVMWFNPVCWFMRKDIRLVHEYLADEGALSTGIDKHRYQALLINQVAEERLVPLSSSFNHSLIKKRMIMMTKSKFNEKSNVKMFSLLPIVAVLVFGVACVNGQNPENENVVAAISLTKMNVLYLGINNPINIAVSGYTSSELEVFGKNCRIVGKDGEYILKPKRPGTVVLKVVVNGDTVQTAHFRVKLVPDPKAKVCGKNFGTVSKSDLLKCDGVEAVMENFDFDLSFTVVEFTLSSTTSDENRFRIDAHSDSDLITKEMKDLINDLKPGKKVYFEDIKAVGPDGKKRMLPTISLLIE